MYQECRPPNVVSLCFVVGLLFHVYPAYPFVSNNIQKAKHTKFHVRFSRYKQMCRELLYFVSANG